MTSLDQLHQKPAPRFSEVTLTLLTHLKAERLKINTPNVSDSTGGFLFHLIQDRGYRHILELGTANGYSSIYLLEAIQSKKSGHLMTIEIQRDTYERAKANLRAYRDKVTLVCSNAAEFLQSAGDLRFDFIFIDALKTATLEHFLIARKLLSPGGTMVVDDVVKFGNKMPDFYEYLEKNGIKYSIIMTDEDDGVMVLEWLC